jgi:4-amino-4-deoxy-L-arabinose transferase-like glycosyltransferase
LNVLDCNYLFIHGGYLNKAHEVETNGNGANWKSKIKKYIVPVTLLVILTIIISWIAYQRVLIQVNIGPGWDTFAFLANAMDFAGKGFGYAEFDRPPFLSFLTSIPFRLGYTNEATIFFVDGILFVFGVVGLYLFLKLRFDSIQSFLGALLFASFPVILSWVGLGYTDVASVSFSIWALYLLVLAVKKDSRFFYLSFPVAMMAFLTRYTAGLILFPILFYILISGRYLQNFKNMVIGVIGSFIVLIPFLILNNEKLGDPFTPFFSFFAGSETSGLESIAYQPNPFYYLVNLSSYISKDSTFSMWLVYIIVFIIIIGIVLYLYDIFKLELMKRRVKGHISKIFNIERTSTKIQAVIFLIFLVLFIGTFNRVSYMTSELIFFVLGFSAFILLKDVKIKDVEIDLLFLSWFMTYFIFHSTFAVKVDRYFITMAPAFSYFVILGISEISNKLRLKIKNVNLTSWVVSLVLVLMLLSSTTSYLYAMPDKEDYIVKDSKITSEWFSKYDPDYKSKLIYSDVWPTFSWYLGTDIKPMPFFKDNKAFNHELEKYNVDYYLTVYGNRSLTSYDQVGQFGTVSVYKKNLTKFENKPLMLYIGKNWQNYLEDVLGFKAFVINGLSKEYGSKSYNQKIMNEAMFLDDYSLDELKKYDALFLYNFAWHDQRKAENLILNYVKDGGTVVIDLSGNLDGIYYGVDKSIFLDTLITRKSLNANPKIRINPKLGNESSNFSPFISEDGGIWYGANYESFGENKIENLVTADGKILIGVQRVGKGRIIWIGYNLVWHAFIGENVGERKLIQDIIFR